MLMQHFPLLLAIALSAGLAVAMMGLSLLLGPRRKNRVKDEVFECGHPPSGDAQGLVHAKFYVVALLFLVFDIEVVFFYPWALAFSDSLSGATGLMSSWVLGEMLIFVGILVAGLVYVWRKGALDWSRAS